MYLFVSDSPDVAVLISTLRRKRDVSKRHPSTMHRLFSRRAFATARAALRRTACHTAENSPHSLFFLSSCFLGGGAFWWVNSSVHARTLSGVDLEALKVNDDTEHWKPKRGKEGAAPGTTSTAIDGAAADRGPPTVLRMVLRVLELGWIFFPCIFWAPWCWVAGKWRAASVPLGSSSHQEQLTGAGGGVSAGGTGTAGTAGVADRSRSSSPSCSTDTSSLVAQHSSVGSSTTTPALDNSDLDSHLRWYFRLVREALENAGPVFIKLGQWGSTRYDLFPPALCDELNALTQTAPEHSFSETKKTLEKTFGGPRIWRFLRLDETPLASGSIGQVYRADLDGVGEVVVKIQHPNLEQILQTDFAIMERFARVFDDVLARKGVTGFRVHKTLKQFQGFMQDQLDFDLEADNLRRFNRNFRSWPHVKFPEPLTSSREVLVETFESGDSIYEYIRMKQRNNNRRKQREERGAAAMLLGGGTSSCVDDVEEVGGERGVGGAGSSSSSSQGGSCAGGPARGIVESSARARAAGGSSSAKSEHLLTAQSSEDADASASKNPFSRFANRVLLRRGNQQIAISADSDNTSALHSSSSSSPSPSSSWDPTHHHNYPHDDLSGLAPLDHTTIQKLGSLGLLTLLKMIIADNFIHADLHPGNILVRQASLPSGLFSQARAFVQNRLLGVGHYAEVPELCILDAGLSAQIEPEKARYVGDFFRAISDYDGRKLGESILALSSSAGQQLLEGEGREKTGDAAFVSELEERSREWRRVRQDPELFQQQRSGDIIKETLEACRLHG